VGAADAPADLVELRESEVVGPVDDERIRRGHVEAVLDDGRREQNVGLPLEELPHAGVEFRRRHLTVGYGDVGFGHEALDALADGAQGLYAVVQEEDLATAVEFAVECILHDFVHPRAGRG
jgi:hypothetical protein